MDEQSVRRKRDGVKIGVAILAMFFIFALGVASGQGHIGLHAHSLGRVGANSSLPANLDYTSVEEVYDELRENFDGTLDKQKLLDGLKKGLVEASGDPYTEYFNESAAKDFNNQLTGSFSGIGAELGKENGNIVVIAPLAGYPAEKAGMKAKDIIAEINGEVTPNMTVSDAVSNIRGEAGTKVKLTVIRANQPLTFEITRENITVPSVKPDILDGNIGYLQISRFGDDTVALARSAAQSFKDKTVSGVILDLRGDPGGLLDAAVGVSSLWLPERATVLQEKRDGTVVKTYTATGDPILSGVKTVVLIDGGSASASEITAGALKDNGAAQLVGQKSYGKGSVQNLLKLGSSLLATSSSSKDGMLKVTIARWYTPKGKNIDKEGITPDIKIEITADNLNAGQDPQKDKAIELIKG